MVLNTMSIRARELQAQRLASLLARNPVVAIVGPRQVGKTTLARMVGATWTEGLTSFDLEDPIDLARLQDPMLALAPLRGLVILDEVHHRPDLFAPLRVLADRPGTPARFLVLGSAAPDLLRQSAESLAGRITYHELSGFNLDEVGVNDWRQLWLRGGFPRSFLAESESESADWRRAFVRTFLERDLPDLGVRIAPGTMRRFWSMLAHYHGNLWNGAELARAFGVSDHTVRRWLDLLVGTFVVRVLQPWHENLSKRQVKSPKVYIADTGLLHSLLDVDDHGSLERHPKVGASFEGFAVDAVIRRFGARPEQCYFWATHNGAELDLLMVLGERRIGVEVKHASAPTLTPSMRTALVDLRLDALLVVHAGPRRYALAERVEALPIDQLDQLGDRLQREEHV